MSRDSMGLDINDQLHRDFLADRIVGRGAATFPDTNKIDVVSLDHQ